MKYRPEIDGLRAVAVLPVIFCHAGFKTFSGGFVGVDVFFVISGYLITLIIHGELQQGSFSIVQFYERRVRRILPALFFVTLVCIPFAWAWMMPDEFKDFSKSIEKVNLFISNFYFWKEANYFAPDAQLAPMLHTWSLAVEEQFYVIFPIFLIVIQSCSQKKLLILTSILVVASLGLSEWWSKIYPVANFYLLPTRAWELGVGSMMALSINYWRHVEGWIAQLASSVGLFLVAFSIFTYDEGTPFPSLWALMPVLGAALIIGYARPQTLVGKFLSWTPVMGVGLISYSAYLWHHPLFAFARIRLSGNVLPEVYFGLSILVLGLAYFTWRFVERPFRKKSTFTRKQIFIGAVIVSSLFIAFGKFGRWNDGVPERLPLEVKQMAMWAKDRDPRRKECHAKKSNFIEPVDSCVYGNELPPKIAILGDSHAMVLASPLGELLMQENQSIRALTYSSCAPVIGYKNSDKVDECPKYNKLVQRFLYSHLEIETLILVARWTLYIEGVRFNNGEGGIEPGMPAYALPISKDMSFIKNPARVDKIGRLFRSTIENILNHGKRVVLVYPVPETGLQVPYYLAKEILFYIGRKDALSTSFKVFKERTENIRKQFDMLGAHRNLIRIRPEDIFCNTFIINRCVVQLAGKPLYFDYDHLNSIGSAMLAEKIITEMKEKNWL